MTHTDISPEPEWEIRQNEGMPLQITGDPESWGSARYLRYEMEEIPEEEGEAVFEVTCKWGEDVCVTEVKVHCIRIDWPTGLVNIDDTVETFVGETIVFEPEIAPSGWTVPGHAQVRWGFDDQVDEFAECEPTTDTLGQIIDRHTLTFRQTGTYYSTYVIISDRVSVGREVMFIIRGVPRMGVCSAGRDHGDRRLCFPEYRREDDPHILPVRKDRGGRLCRRCGEVLLHTCLCN